MRKIQIIEIVISLIAYVTIKIVIRRYIDRIVSTNVSTKKRSKVAKKVINLIVLSIFLIVIFSIFGVDQSELVVFIGLVLTVMGIALFAQWQFYQILHRVLLFS